MSKDDWLLVTHVLSFIHSFILSSSSFRAFVYDPICSRSLCDELVPSSIAMVNDKILYERTHVIVKERWAPNEPRTGLAEEINGTITILDNDRRKCFRFIPYGIEDSMNDDWALIHGNHSVVSYKSQEKDSASIQPNPLLKFRFFFNLNELQSVRRYHMLQGIGHMAFTLKDGRALPIFYFNLGGSKELLHVLCQHLPLQK